MDKFLTNEYLFYATGAFLIISGLLVNVPAAHGVFLIAAGVTYILGRVIATKDEG